MGTDKLITTNTSIVVQVAVKAAIVNAKGEVLIVREAASGQNNTIVGRWSLVGGRLDPGEAFDDGLQREVYEETGLRVMSKRPLHVGEWRPVIHGVPHQIIAVFMFCTIEGDDGVRLSVEHDQYRWVTPQTRHDYNMIDPDCFVVDMASAVL